MELLGEDKAMEFAQTDPDKATLDTDKAINTFLKTNYSVTSIKWEAITIFLSLAALSKMNANMNRLKMAGKDPHYGAEKCMYGIIC